MFVDRISIMTEAGRGGDGCASFRREKYVPRGGPDGGDGGNAGSVIILAENGVDSLSALLNRKHWRAKNGRPGEGSKRHGAGADDLIIRVPPGTVVRDKDGDFILKDLAQDGDSVIAAQGGKGGKGNARFKSSTNQSPREFQKGTAGEVRNLLLELKVIADVGLVGKPNAGKSTLLSRVSRARPEIADYPFTTKKPNLGIVQVDISSSFVMADIPGLIEGASQGVGLGHEFLRHVERTRVLVHLVEPMPTDETDPIKNYKTIVQEVKEYDQNLAARPQIVAVSKSELPIAEEVRQKLEAETGEEVLSFSAVTGDGLDKLLRKILNVLSSVET